MGSFLYNTSYFLLAIGILVVFHEYGHFIMARWLGIKVLRFSVGFGRVLWSRRDRQGTEFCLSAVPFGGYVKMLDESTQVVEESEQHRAFNRQAVWKRSLVVFAGPLFNLLFTVLVYWLIFMLGVSRVMPVVGHVQAGSSAAHAGIMAKQQFLQVDGKATLGWQEVSGALSHALKQQTSVAVVLKNHDQSQFKTRLDLSQLPLKAKFPLSKLGIRPMLPNIPNHIERVMPDSPAEKAGVRAGDKILSINSVAVKSWNNMIQYIRAHPEATVYRLQLQRGKQPLQVTITPKKHRLPNGDLIPMMGIQSALAHYGPELLTTERYLPWHALIPALNRTVAATTATTSMLVKLLSGQASLQAVTGPVGIAITAGHAARSGLVEFLHFLAMISVSLALINLLPLPVLDGGHLLFYFIEAIRRRPLAERTQQLATEMGLYLIFGLMVVVSINDIIIKAFH
jgi:regulator of sigma E protease